MTSESSAASDDAFIKRQVFVRVQRVVVHEHRDRPLRREQVRRVFNGAAYSAGRIAEVFQRAFFGDGLFNGNSLQCRTSDARAPPFESLFDSTESAAGMLR